MGVPLAIQGFTALVIGGVGRVEGALLGGLLLAFAEQLTVRYAPLPAGYAQGVPLLLLMLFLLVRPTGLLRARQHESARGWLRGVRWLSALAFFLSGYYNDVYRKLLLWIALALSYNFLFGISGQVAFSHFAFYGIGAYAVVIFLFQLGMPLPVAIVSASAIWRARHRAGGRHPVHPARRLLPRARHARARAALHRGAERRRRRSPAAPAASSTTGCRRCSACASPGPGTRW